MAELTQQDVDNLILMCRKIIQAYRIRLGCLRRRHEVLTAIDHKFENIASYKGVEKKNVLSGEAGFYSILETTLRREKKVLAIEIEGAAEEREMVKKIQYVISKLKDFDEIINNTDVDDYRGKTISAHRLRKFIEQIILFLGYMIGDLEKIMKRVESEERFLDKSGRNPKNFERFVDAWRKEVKANKILVKHYRNILKSNPRLIRNLKKSHIAVLTGTASSAIIVATEKPANMGVTGLTITIALILAGTVVSLHLLSRPELMDLKADKKMLRHLKRLKVV